MTKKFGVVSRKYNLFNENVTCSASCISS